MSSRNLDDKVNFILNKFNDPNEFVKYGVSKKYHAKLWNIDTSVLTILEQMELNIKNLTKPIYEIVVKEVGINEKGNKLFSMFIHEKNITPSRIKKQVSDAATMQYLQILSSLGIVMFGSQGIKDIAGSYNVSSNFKSTICSNKDSELIKRLIVFCLKRNIEYSRNLAFSIFISILQHFNYDFSHIDLRNQKIEKKRNKDDVKFFNVNNTYASFYISDCRKRTYGKLVEHTMKNESLDQFISDIFNILSGEDENYFDRKIEEEQIHLQNMLEALKKERSRFKEEIRKNREELKLLNPDDNIYSDIITIDNNDIKGIGRKFNELNAAHIYNVWQIKGDLIKKVIEFKEDNDSLSVIIDYVKNPFNGLMMNGEYHEYFDRNYFTFNVNGEMIYREEDAKYLFEDIKLKKVKINPKILNEEMKRFLSIRKF